PDPGYGVGIAPPLGSAFAADLSNVSAGPFVTVDGVAIPVPGDAGASLDPSSAWLDGATQAGQVGVAFQPRANGLGVLLANGATAMDATLRRLSADDGPAFEARRAVGLRFGIGTDRAPYVVFRAPGGLGFPAGLYAIDAEWTDAAGRQRATFHVELQPGQLTTDPPLLGAARAFAGSAGGDALIIAGPDEGVALAPPLAQVPLRAGGTVAGTDVECGGDPALAAVRPTVMGLTHAVGDAPSEVSAQLQFSGGRSSEVPLLVSPDVLPGLTLLAPGNGDGLALGVYRVTIGDGPSGRHATFCLGTIVID
ncbi:MAG TPA: hypothetical protein VD763_10620, partial [Candidatus Saccharimonadales bacterium]|nr:hypothetical protein [Candidatus Saccharimonadales bacterium]